MNQPTNPTPSVPASQEPRPIEPKGYAQVIVWEIEPVYCDYCDDEVPVTHRVQVTHWFGSRGYSSTIPACKKHAREIEQEMRKQIGKP